jgi:amino acid transporter
MHEVMSSEAGWNYTGQWWIWVALMTVIVFLLTYRDIRLSTTAGVILGAFEIAVFATLALWMLFSNTGSLNVQPFEPHNAVGGWSGVFRGMVFAILAFIGFEAAAPLGEEAKHPRRTVPFAVVGSALAIGLFYVLTAYAWVFGAGFHNFVAQATGADPWRNLGKVFWGTGWVVVFLAICNSIAANSNAAVNAATRVFYALARNRLAPRPLGHVHPRFKTPTNAIIGMSLFAFILSLLLGWKWGPLIGFSLIATLAVIVVVVVYMLICAGAIWEYWVRRRTEFNPLLHLVLPIGGIVLFFFPLYYQYYKFVPTYPIKYANWIAIAWIGIGIVLTAWLTMTRPERLKDMERVYVEDETVAPESGAAPTPA